MFIGGRFLVGMGSNLSQGSAPLLIMELSHPAHRGKLTVMYNTLWYVGSIVAAWTVFGTQGYTTNASWQIPVGMQALMPCIMLCGIWLLPESPRWLVSRDRGDEALGILARVGPAQFSVAEHRLIVVVSCEWRHPERFCQSRVC